MNLKPAFRRSFAVWLALLVLLALTCGSAYLPMGSWNTVANFGIAAIKALLVACFFMHLRAGHPVYRMTAITALCILTLLLGLSLSDYGTRARDPAPYQTPDGAISKVH